MKSSNPNPSWQADIAAVLIITLAAGLLRWLYGNAFLAAFPQALTPANDARAYWELSLAIYREGWLLRDHGPFYQAPLYPYALACLHHLGYHLVRQVIAFQLVLGVINVLLTYVMARFWLPAPWAGLAALVFAFSPLPLIFETKLLATTLGLMLYLLFALALLAWVRWGGWPWLMTTGLLYSLAVLCRPNQLFALPFILLLIAWVSAKRNQLAIWRSALQYALPFLLIVMMGIAPVTLRNALIGGDPVPITGNTGVTLYMGTNPHAQGGLAPIEGLSNDIEDQRTQSIALAEERSGQSMTAAEASRWWIGETLRWAAGHPLEFILLESKKLIWALYAVPPAVNYSLHFESTFFPWLDWLNAATILILAGGLAALPLLFPLRPDQRSVMLAILAGYLLLSLIYYASDRFLAAVLPFLAVLMAQFLQRCRAGLARKQALALGLAAALALLLAANPWLGWNAPRETANGFYNLGVFYEERGADRQAEQAYRDALEYQPNHIATMLNLGVLLAEQGDLRTSTRLFEQVLEAQPGHPLAQRNLQINRRRMQGSP